MENSKKIAIILGIGGIALVVFYFIRKSKPTVADEQLLELNTNTTTPIQEELETTPTVDEQLLIDKCAGLGRGEREVCMGIPTPPVAEGVPIRTSPIRSGTRTNVSGRRR